MSTEITSENFMSFVQDNQYLVAYLIDQLGGKVVITVDSIKAMSKKMSYSAVKGKKDGDSVALEFFEYDSKKELMDDMANYGCSCRPEKDDKKINKALDDMLESISAIKASKVTP